MTFGYNLKRFLVEIWFSNFWRNSHDFFTNGIFFLKKTFLKKKNPRKKWNLNKKNFLPEKIILCNFIWFFSTKSIFFNESSRLICSSFAFLFHLQFQIINFILWNTRRAIAFDVPLIASSKDSKVDCVQKKNVVFATELVDCRSRARVIDYEHNYGTF